MSHEYSCYYKTRGRIYMRLSPYIEWIQNVTNFSLTSYTPPTVNYTTTSTITYNHTTTSSSQRPNNFTIELILLLFMILL